MDIRERHGYYWNGGIPILKPQTHDITKHRSIWNGGYEGIVNLLLERGRISILILQTLNLVERCLCTLLVVGMGVVKLLLKRKDLNPDTQGSPPILFR